MEFTPDDMNILNRLVGQLTEETVEMMGKNLECFFHPKVSLFIPSLGPCKYALSPSHTHPSYTFIYYFQSVNDFITEDIHISYDLTDGKCLSAMSPGIPHQEMEEDHFQSYIAIAIDAELFQKIALQYLPKIPVFRGEAYVPHRELLNVLRCFMLAAGETGYHNSELLNNLAEVITHLIMQSVRSEIPDAIPLYDRFEVDKTIAYMNSHFSEKITTEDLAERVNLSAGHFSKIFKAVSGESPIDFLNTLRLQKARTMLMNREENITNVALKCGFQSSSYFSTCFLEKYRMTPSAYRQIVLKTNETSEY